MDESLDIFVDSMLGDVTHLFLDDLRATWKFTEDVAFRASGDEEMKVGWKGAFSDFLRDGM